MTTAASYFPIIYVRGYAMTRGEIDDTTADPFCGFNVGSTVQRATSAATKAPKKFIFESPVVRLRSDYGYEDVYRNGVDILDPDWEGELSRNSIIIHRYYDPASMLLGAGETPDIGSFAKELRKLILRVRALVCAIPTNGLTPATFRCYLVAHSMGGLVCRAFLQNPAYDADDAQGSADARASVDKFFTYATPHNGIELGGLNVPSWFGVNDINNFNRDHMARYLNVEALYAKTGRVDWIPEAAFPSRRIFCMIGTNRGDYDAGAGLSRTFAGHGSDGLVRIANASVWGIDDKGQLAQPCATAYTYRSHSGFFGIVNSEEAYQSLVRFLFGDVRVDIWVDVDDVQVPQELQADDRAGKVSALYQFEVLAGARGKRWFFTRRTAEEDSVACRTHAELRSQSGRSVYLSSVFLSNKFKIDPSSATLAYSLKLGVRAPDYEVDRRFWPNRHYEGQYLFQDSVAVELRPPAAAANDWSITYDWQSDNVGQSETLISTTQLANGEIKIEIPFHTKDTTPPISPGISGKLRFVISSWNA